jgi:hypothetical protein
MVKLSAAAIIHSPPRRDAGIDDPSPRTGPVIEVHPLVQQAQQAITAVEKFGENQIENNVEDQRQTEYWGTQKHQKIDDCPSGKTPAGQRYATDGRGIEERHA